MQTKEAEKRTGITAKNMQFYEQEKLICPERNPLNRYRDYSEEDIEKLNQIKVLRMLGIAIPDIRSCFEKETDLKDLLIKRTQELDQEIEAADHKKMICEIFIQQDKHIHDLSETDVQLLEDEIINYKFALEKLHKKDKRKKRVNKIMDIVKYLLILLIGIFFLVQLFNILTDAVVYTWGLIPFAIMGIWLLIAIIRAIWIQKRTS